MSDNTTPHQAGLYDRNILITIPYYRQIHEEILAFLESLEEQPRSWLDTGCGTGTLIFSAQERFPDTSFTLADPSPQMLRQAAEKCPGERIRILEPCSTERLEPGCKYDLITAIQCHHYLDLQSRRQAVERCFSLLRPGGLFITSENIRPLSRDGEKTGLRYWGNFQKKAGKSREEVAAHLSRFDTEYHPLTILQHLDLYRSAGFTPVDLLWFSYMQAVFYAKKSPAGE